MRFAVLAAAAAVALAAQSFARQEVHVVDESFTEPDGDRVILLSIEVPARPEEVWERWTTSEGWTSFATPHALVDFRVGGVAETSYGESFEPGAPNNIKNEFLAYVPGRAIALRAVQAPPGFPNPELFFQTSTMVVIEPLGEGAHVVVSGTGFRPGADFDQLYGMFRAGNALTLENLRRSFVDGPIDWAAGRAEAEKAVETHE